jgi:hypothetical protein
MRVARAMQDRIKEWLQRKPEIDAAVGAKSKLRTDWKIKRGHEYTV